MYSNPSESLRAIALIPARAGSKRLANKNIKPLAGHPLIAYTIQAAKQSEIFSDVLVSTDSERYAEIARYYGAQVPFLRPRELASDFSPDIEWVEHTLMHLKEQGKTYDCFSILRPTSPFRRAETVRRAWEIFRGEKEADSLRAVEKCKQHPGKMWIVRGRRMTPLLPFGPQKQPWHSSQYASLPEVYVQNASLEIAWTRIVFQERTIAGNAIIPFLTQGREGFDLNDEGDWELAEQWIQSGKISLPSIAQTPFPSRECSSR